MPSRNSNGKTVERIAVIAGATLIILVSIVAIILTGNPELFVVIAPTVAALLALYQARQATTKIEQTEIKVDGRLTELLKLTESSAKAQGVLEGQKDKGRE